MSILNSVAMYIEYLPIESQHSQWTLVIQELEILFRRIEPLMNKLYDYTCLFLIMGTLFKISSIVNNKVRNTYNLLDIWYIFASYILY